MSQNEKYTLLLMRDDTRVRRMRVSPGWLKFLLTLFVLVLVCGGAAIWLGSKLWVENRELKTDLQALQQESLLMQMRLERLSTFEQVLQNANPGEINTILSQINERQSLPDSTTPPEGPETAENGTPSSDPAVPPDESTNGPATAENGGQAADPAPDANSTETAALPPSMDEGKVGLDNLSIRLVGSNNRLELAYDMVNLDANNRAEGRLLLYVVTDDRQVLPLTLPSAASLYSMSARKIVSRYSLALPEAARGGKAASLMAEMLLNGNLSFRQYFDVPVNAD